MASLPFSPLVLGISISILISLFFSPVSAVTCATQKLPSNRNYTTCINLPTLNTTLHYTYNATNHTLSIAFAADSPTSDGWVGWGINPTAPRMNGTAALVATKEGGNVTVKTYNLGQGTIKQEKLPFEVLGIAAQDDGGVITIFATWKLPEKSDNLSQVWQVGPVKNGAIAIHATAPANLGATAALKVVETAVAPSGSQSGEAPSGSQSGEGPPTSGEAPSGSQSGGGPTKNGGVKMMGDRFGMGFYFGLVLVLVSFMSM